MTKEQLFEKTSGGLDIFAALIPEVDYTYKQGKLFRSVLREDKTPSANLLYSQKDNIWLYKDFANDKAINAIDLLMQVKGLSFKDAMAAAQDIANILPADRPVYTPPVSVIVRPSIEKINQVLSNLENEFIAFCREKLKISNEVFRSYNVGTAEEKSRASGNKLSYCAFAFKNIHGQFVNIKKVHYLETGKRNKDEPIKSLVSSTPGEKFEMCLFGEHLLAEEGTKPVVIVESEKTAIIASAFYPDFIWIASRGQQVGSSDDFVRTGLANGRMVLVLCDADPVRKVPASFKALHDMKANVHLIDLQEDRKDKTDIADYIIEGSVFPIELPKSKVTIDEDTGERYYESSMPKWAKRIIYKLTPRQIREERDARREAESDGDGEDTRDKYDFIPLNAYFGEYDTEEDLRKYSLFIMNRSLWSVSGNDVQSYKLYPLSNFTMKILFHVDSNKSKKRLIEITNNKGTTKHVEADAAHLTSLGKFQEFMIDQGNFNFTGNLKNLSDLRRKLLDDELNAQQIDFLGWNIHHKFFAFSNGVHDGQKWYPTDERGILLYKEKSLYIESANESNNGMLLDYINEKRIAYAEREINIEQWSALHYEVFGNAGMIGQLFGFASVFSDYIFKAKNGFPLLFLYGQGGSGKGQLFRSIQHLFGEPQEPIFLSGKASTPKALVRKLAQFPNITVLLEEYEDSPENIKFIKGIWDRIGYERGTMDHTYRTQTVPILSTAMVTGNYYPTDDPAIQRLLIYEMNKNQFSEAEKIRFSELKAFESGNLTQLLVELLKLRQNFEKEFKDSFDIAIRELSMSWANMGTTDRMLTNASIIVATFMIVNKYIKLGFSKEQLIAYMGESMMIQCTKRATGSEASEFFNIFAYIIEKGDLKYDEHFTSDGKLLYIRLGVVHPYYSKYCRELTGKMGVAKSSLSDKLKEFKAFSSYENAKRFSKASSPTSCFAFKIDKLSADVINAIEGAQNLARGVPKDVSTPFTGQYQNVGLDSDSTPDEMPF